MAADQTDRAAHEHSLPRPAPRSMLSDEVYGILRDSLISGRIEPGARLNLDQLARELYVSNTPVRQALARLESDGLVTKEPYRGFTASLLLDSRAITEYYDYRMILEPEVAARAARLRTDEGVGELEAMCEKAEITRLVGDPAESVALGERDIHFHGLVADQSGNRLIAENVRSTAVRMSRFTLYPRHSSAGELAWAEHRVITAAIKAGDADAAAAAMREHLTSAFDRFREAVHREGS